MKKWVVWIAFLLAVFGVMTLVDYGMRRQCENIPRTYWDVGENVPSANPAIKDGQWDVIRLGVAEYPAPPEGVYMTLTRVKEDAVVAVVHNDTEESWEYGYGHTLQVKLEDKWYVVPKMQGNDRNYVLIGLSASFLDPGQAVEQTYGLGDWGELPAGAYCIVKEINQGTIPDNTFVQCYLTVEFEIR